MKLLLSSRSAPFDLFHEPQLAPPHHTGANERNPYRHWHGDLPEMDRLFRGTRNALKIHPKEAGHKAERQEDNRHDGENEDGIAVLILPSLHELDIFTCQT